MDRKLLDDVDVVVADVPPIPCVMPIVRMARERRIPIVADFRDLWHPVRVGSPFGVLSPRGRRRSSSNAAVEELITSADVIVYTSPDAISEAQRIFPTVAPSRFRLITNSYDRVHEPSPRQRQPDEALTLVHAGSLAYGRDRLLMKFLEVLAERRTSFRLKHLGDAPEHIHRAIVDMDLGGIVSIEGWLQRDRALQEQLDADALLLLQPTDGSLSERVLIPAKLFEYMSIRRPILSLATNAANALVHDHRLGVAVADRTASAIADALDSLSAWIRTSSVLPEPPHQYSETHTVAQFAEVLDELIAARSREVASQRFVRE